MTAQGEPRYAQALTPPATPCHQGPGGADGFSAGNAPGIASTADGIPPGRRIAARPAGEARDLPPPAPVGSPAPAPDSKERAEITLEQCPPGIPAPAGAESLLRCDSMAPAAQRAAGRRFPGEAVPTEAMASVSCSHNPFRASFPVGDGPAVQAGGQRSHHAAHSVEVSPVPQETRIAGQPAAEGPIQSPYPGEREPATGASEALDLRGCNATVLPAQSVAGEEGLDWPPLQSAPAVEGASDPQAARAGRRPPVYTAMALTVRAADALPAPPNAAPANLPPGGRAEITPGRPGGERPPRSAGAVTQPAHPTGLQACPPSDPAAFRSPDACEGSMGHAVFPTRRAGILFPAAAALSPATAAREASGATPDRTPARPTDPAGWPEMRPESAAAGPLLEEAPEALSTAIRRSGRDAVEPATAACGTVPAGSAGARSASIPEARNGKEPAAPRAESTRPALNGTHGDETTAGHVSRPVKEISVRLHDGRSEPVEVRLLHRNGELKVAVHTPDPSLAGAMRDGIGELTHRLAQSGYSTDTWRPPGSEPAQRPEGGERQGGFPSRESGSGRQDADQRNGKNHQPESPWRAADAEDGAQRGDNLERSYLTWLQSRIR